jgi:hypothetical protein
MTKDQAACKVTEITPAMIEAGVSEIHEKYFGCDLGELAQSVYLAMEIERQSHLANSKASSSTALK